MKLGHLIRNHRIKVLEKSLRSFCLEHKLEPFQWLLIESGYQRPDNIEHTLELLQISKKNQLYHDIIQAYNNFYPEKLTEEVLNGMLPHPSLQTLTEEQKEQLKQTIKKSFVKKNE